MPRAPGRDLESAELRAKGKERELGARSKALIREVIRVSGGTSTIREFTKRRNDSSQKPVELKA
jgi:hypothetical protein